MPIFLLLLLPLASALTWIAHEPENALALVAALKRNWRQYLIRAYGQRAFQEITVTWRGYALRKGFSPEVIDTVLHEHQATLIQRYGTESAAQQLGEVTFLEDVYER